MGMFDFLFKKGHGVDDDFFGPMVYVDCKDKAKSYYECCRHFVPKSAGIELGVAGDKNGPTQIQKDFFVSIEKDYSKISDSIVPIIEEEVNKWKPGFRIRDFKNEFTPVYMFIPHCDVKPIRWEIAFETDHDKDHRFSVTMNDMTVTKILIDG